MNVGTNERQIIEKLNTVSEEMLLLIPEASPVSNPLLITGHSFHKLESFTGKILDRSAALQLMDTVVGAQGNKTSLAQAPLLALFFYLQQQSLSMAFMETWFVESGLSGHAATELAGSIYWLRLERDDETMESLINHHAIISTPGADQQTQSIAAPAEVSEAFALAANNDTIILYGLFDVIHSKGKPSASLLKLELLNETNFLVEDEAHLLLGFSLPVFTLMAVTAGPLPSFTKWLKTHTEIAARTYQSLGFITEYFFNESIAALSRDVDQVNLVSYHPATGFTQQTFTKDWKKHSGAQPDYSGLPLFLLLNKHSLTG
ncbi:MAG: hypothetical protein PHX54_00260 [Lentimicrobiaceae bacterium]|nr:hypothetical protein [Lentimicrobiaceae bacterium]